jgi:hypothetical protein
MRDVVASCVVSSSKAIIWLVTELSVGATRDAAVDGALDLLGGSGRTPDKAVRGSWLRQACRALV